MEKNRIQDLLFRKGPPFDKTHLTKLATFSTFTSKMFDWKNFLDDFLNSKLSSPPQTASQLILKPAKAKEAQVIPTLNENSNSDLRHTLGRRITPIFCFCQWCNTRLLRRSRRQDFYRSCGRLRPGNCFCEGCVLTTSGTPFQRSSLLLFPRNLCQLYHFHPHSDNLVENDAMKPWLRTQL